MTDTRTSSELDVLHRMVEAAEQHASHWEVECGRLRGQDELCARCTPERDHNGVLCRRCANKELGRLQQQLDAAVELAKDIIDFTKNEAPDEWDGGNIGYSLGGICSLADDFLVACAALGVGDD